MKQYEVWWALLPAPAGRRPILLLSRNSAYKYLNKFLAAEITSTIRGIPVEVTLGPEDGLPGYCAANLDNIRLVSPSELVKRIAQLPTRRVADVKRALGSALAWDELG